MLSWINPIALRGCNSEARMHLVSIKRAPFRSETRAVRQQTQNAMWVLLDFKILKSVSLHEDQPSALPSAERMESRRRMS